MPDLLICNARRRISCPSDGGLTRNTPRLWAPIFLAAQALLLPTIQFLIDHVEATITLAYLLNPDCNENTDKWACHRLRGPRVLRARGHLAPRGK